MRSLIFSIVCAGALLGCTSHVGPNTLTGDSIAFNHAVQDSIDKQLLLNMVRMRYRDTAGFLDIGIISSAYDYKRSGNLTVKGDSLNSNTLLGATGFTGVEFTEKPTTTFQPLSGEGLVKRMMSPVPIQTLLLLKSSGWRLDRVLRCCVQRMNNLRNAPTASGPTPEMAPEYEKFLELMALFRQLEQNDAIDVLTERGETGKHVEILISFDLKLADRKVMKRIWELLEVEHESCNVKLIPFHCRKRKDNEVFVDTRSPFSVFYFLSQSVHVPEWDEAYGKVTVTQTETGERFNWNNVLGGLMTIHSDQCVMGDSSVSIVYRGTRFYIDDSDLDSKSTFSLIAQLLALQTGTPIIPALTIPLRD